MKVLIHTLGCPKNENDSEHLTGLLEKEGHEIISDLDKADVVIVNTCGFINDAKRESVNAVLSYGKAKKKNSLLVVTGCLSQRYPRELFSEIEEADIIIGVNDYLNLPRLLETYKERILKVTETPSDFLDYELRITEEGSVTSYLRLSEGCDNCCTYCAIPLIRGPYRSRRIEDILTEAKALSEKGIKELILIGQDVTNYGIDLYGKLVLPELLKELNDIEGIKWIRLMYCYEDKITEALIEQIRDLEKVVKYIDIPLQHLSDNVLRKMNRRSTQKSIYHTVSRLRERVPEIRIRTTFITGFPGETERDFQILLEGIMDLEFDRLGVFAYSEEEGTPAYSMKGKVALEIRELRRDKLMEAQLEISLKKNLNMKGETLEVLVEDEEEKGVYLGRTRYDAPSIDNSVIFTSDEKLKKGDFVNVYIEDGFDYDLKGIKV